MSDMPAGTDKLTGIVKAVCVSEKKGTEKKGVDRIHVRPCHGIDGDAHAGNWHRQVSLLSYDKVREFNERGANVDHGAFGENLASILKACLWEAGLQWVPRN